MTETETPRDFRHLYALAESLPEAHSRRMQKVLERLERRKKRPLRSRSIGQMEQWRRAKSMEHLSQELSGTSDDNHTRKTLRELQSELQNMELRRRQVKTEIMEVLKEFKAFENEGKEPEEQSDSESADGSQSSGDGDRAENFFGRRESPRGFFAESEREMSQILRESSILKRRARERPASAPMRRNEYVDFLSQAAAEACSRCARSEFDLVAAARKQTKKSAAAKAVGLRKRREVDQHDAADFYDRIQNIKEKRWARQSFNTKTTEVFGNWVKSEAVGNEQWSTPRRRERGRPSARTAPNWKNSPAPQRSRSLGQKHTYVELHRSRLAQSPHCLEQSKTSGLDGTKDGVQTRHKRSKKASKSGKRSSKKKIETSKAGKKNGDLKGSSKAAVDSVSAAEESVAPPPKFVEVSVAHIVEKVALYRDGPESPGGRGAFVQPLGHAVLDRGAPMWSVREGLRRCAGLSSIKEMSMVQKSPRNPKNMRRIEFRDPTVLRGGEWIILTGPPKIDSGKIRGDGLHKRNKEASKGAEQLPFGFANEHLNETA